MVKIGVIGAGHLGKIHLRLLKDIPAFDVVGFYDQDPTVRAQVGEELGVTAAPDWEALLGQVDAVDVVVPTLAHSRIATQALAADKHVFIEKPVTHTVAEADHLLALQQAKPHLKVQVGHVERFNPAFLAVKPEEITPMFIEGHRLAMYNPRGTDVSVILDLMIHDLDIVLSLVPSPVVEVSASGVAVISSSPDIANARIQFSNGCVANLTASRISIKNMRRLRLFQKNTYLALDFLEKKTEKLHLTDQPQAQVSGRAPFPLESGEQTRYLHYEQPEVQAVNAIQMELQEFAQAIREEAPIRVSLADGVRALRIAHQVLEEIEANFRKYAT